MPAKLLQEKIYRFLAEKGIPVFDYGEVDNYLTNIAYKMNRFWIWRPLRDRDKTNNVWPGHRADGELQRFGHGSYQVGSRYRRYDKAVPLHILKQVQIVEEEFEEQVGFFVSDYAVTDPDPFIMVTALDIDRIIFGVWDEPSFFGKAVDHNKGV